MLYVSSFDKSGLTWGDKMNDTISPISGYPCAAIVAGKMIVVDMFAAMPKSIPYLPLNSVRIINNSAQNINVYHDYYGTDNARRLPSKTERRVNGYAFSKIVIENLGALDIASGEIYLEVAKL
jgi:hypothetical protein